MYTDVGCHRLLKDARGGRYAIRQVRMYFLESTGTLVNLVGIGYRFSLEIGLEHGFHGTTSGASSMEGFVACKIVVCSTSILASESF